MRTWPCFFICFPHSQTLATCRLYREPVLLHLLLCPFAGAMLPAFVSAVAVEAGQRFHELTPRDLVSLLASLAR